MARRICLLFLAFSLTVFAWAKPQDKEEYTRLARISYIEGPVSYQHATDVDWSAASINMPLEPGDRIYTSPDGRAEIEFDDGSVYRLARNTDVEILSLRENLIQLRVLVGLSSLIVRSNTDFEINTPAAAFNVLREGSYRFFVDENGDSDAIVRKGKIEAANNNYSRKIDSGEMLHFTLSNIGNPEFARYERRDDWDEWNDRRNADMTVYVSRKYLPDTVYIGASDLHRHGRWIEIETYGSAWVPFSVGVSWTPYSVGRWSYRPLFGWTWISYEPWGWLPYHYGRWYRSAIYGWCWLPGPAFSFNFWSPGLVAFYNGPGWISWCPLGPGDYYNVHHYHYNRGIFAHQLNELARLHTRPQGHLFHRDAPGAFRTTHVDRFRDGSFGDGNRGTHWTNVDQPWKRGEYVRDSLSIRPTSTSYRAAPDRQASRPQGTKRLPAVVRSSPASSSRGSEHFARITNPNIPALPSREERTRSIQEESRSTYVPRTNARAVQTPQRQGGDAAVHTPQRERSGPAVDNPAGNRPAEESGRRMETPRSTRATDNNRQRATVRESTTQREYSTPGESSSKGSRSESGSGAARQSTTRGSSESAAPQQKQIQRAPSESRPQNERAQPSKAAEPRSSASGRWNAENPAAASASRAGRSRAYSAPQTYAARSYTAPEGNASRAYTKPQASTLRSYAAPEAGASRTYTRPQASTSRSYSTSRSNSSPSFNSSRQSSRSFAGSGNANRSGSRSSSGGGHGRR
ncbi:MAG: FecR domain-containing protein [Acidobacteria bacterium]|nr:FecR domain-containing protein [Acidobacteriota bacterium]